MKKIIYILSFLLFIIYCINADLYKRGTDTSKLTSIIKDGQRLRVYKSNETLFSGLETKDFGDTIRDDITSRNIKTPEIPKNRNIKTPEIPKNEISAMIERGRPFWKCYLCKNNTGNILVRHRAEIPYQNGLINGLMKVYSSDGKLYETTNFVDGNADGIQSAYYWKGFFRVDYKYVNGYRVAHKKNHYAFCYDEKNNKIPCD